MGILLARDKSQRSWKKDYDDVGGLAKVATNRKSLKMLESLAELEKMTTILRCSRVSGQQTCGEVADGVRRLEHGGDTVELAVNERPLFLVYLYV